MKKSLFLILGVTLGIVFLILLGSIFQIGDKLGELTFKWVEYGFYILVSALIVIFIVIPVVKVQCAPEMPALTTDGVLDARKVADLGDKLVRNCGYIADEEERKEHKKALAISLKEASGDLEMLSEAVNAEISYRLEGDQDGPVIGIDRKIREWARTVFLVTAISQNSKMDSLAMIGLNYKMIEDLVLSSGFRPSRPQMLKIYARVLVTSLISYLASDALGDFSKDLSQSIPGVGADMESGEYSGNKLLSGLRKSKWPSVFFGSALDGAINALMTLRIGFVTRSCILKGSEALAEKGSRRKIRSEAMKDAYKNISGVILNSASVIGKSAASRLAKFFTGEEEAEDL